MGSKLHKQKSNILNFGSLSLFARPSLQQPPFFRPKRELYNFSYTSRITLIKRYNVNSSTKFSTQSCFRQFGMGTTLYLMGVSGQPQPLKSSPQAESNGISLYRCSNWDQHNRSSLLLTT